MNIQEIYQDKNKIIEGILSEGYPIFEYEIEHDDNYTLSTDEIAELYYELISEYIKRLN
jgi:predicted GNAT superfamily acetyltransferase